MPSCLPPHFQKLEIDPVYRFKVWYTAFLFSLIGVITSQKS